jgi:hypothetical protein
MFLSLILGFGCYWTVDFYSPAFIGRHNRDMKLRKRRKLRSFPLEQNLSSSPAQAELFYAQTEALPVYTYFIFSYLPIATQNDRNDYGVRFPLPRRNEKKVNVQFTNKPV